MYIYSIETNNKQFIMNNFKRTSGRISEVITGNEHRDYKHIEAYGKAANSTNSWIAEQQWKAFHMNAPIDTCRFEGVEPIVMSELNKFWQTGVSQNL